MLADSLRSEAWRFLKNRTAVFWSVLFVPIAGLLIAIATFLFIKAQGDALAAGKLSIEGARSGPLDLGASLVSNAADLAGPAALLFILTGAATLYAGDYRWETWRLISARNTRVNLVLGKVGIVIGLALAAMLALLLSGLISDLVQASVFARPLAFGFDGEAALQFLGLSALSWVRIVQFTMLALLTAVVTRSLLASLFVPLVVGIAQVILMQMMPVFGLDPMSWRGQLLTPYLAFETLKAAIEGGVGAARMPDGAALKAATSLALWTLVPLAAAIAWFRRQDLSKE